MINLFLAVFFSTILFVVFKLYSKFNINTLQAIVWNYLVAFTVGILITEKSITISELPLKTWFYASLLLGTFFIAVFFTMGKTSQLNGVSTASVASKMSMIVPILFGIFFLKENLSVLQTIGILIALFAVYFSTKKEKGKPKSNNFIFPVLLFIGAGIVDTSINYIQNNFVPEEELSVFSAFTFLTAFVIGCFILLFQYFKNKTKLEPKNIVGGLALGVPNYFSMYYLIKALQNKELESASVFTMINVGIILLTTVFAVFLFKEKLLKQNYIGIALALLALVLITQ